MNQRATRVTFSGDNVTSVISGPKITERFDRRIDAALHAGTDLVVTS